MKPLLALLTALAFASPGVAGDTYDDGGTVPHQFRIAGLEIDHPWTRASDDGTALLFMDLHNEGAETITLTGAFTEDGAQGGLVGFRLQGAEIGHDAIATFPVEPDQSIDLGPDGLAIRLEGLDHALEKGEVWEVMLETSAGVVPLLASVEAADAGQHSHAGHAH